MSNQITIVPDKLPALSKTKAADFHKEVRTRILETGEGLFEYIELIRFFGELSKHINGEAASKIEADKELIEMVRTEIEKNSGEVTTASGSKFVLAETGTTYDYSQCNDPVLANLESQLSNLQQRIKSRKELLKNLNPTTGMPILDEETGEVRTVYPPAKSSKSTFKITLKK